MSTGVGGGNGSGCFAGPDTNSSYCVSVDRNEPGYNTSVSRYESSSYYNRTGGGESGTYYSYSSNSRGSTSSRRAQNQAPPAPPNYEPSSISTQKLAESVLKLTATTEQHNQSVQSLTGISRAFKEEVGSLKGVNERLKELLAASGNHDRIRELAPQRNQEAPLDCSVMGYINAGVGEIGENGLKEGQRTTLDLTRDVLHSINSRGNPLQDPHDDGPERLRQFIDGMVGHALSCNAQENAQ